MNMKIIFLIFLIFSCSPKPPTATINVINPPKNSTPEVVAEIDGMGILNSQVEKGIEVDVFELEEKIFNLKMDRLKVIMTEIFMNQDPRKAGLTNDEYFEKYIGKNSEVSQSDLDFFVKTRGITKDQLNGDITPKIKNFLSENKKKKALEEWLNREIAQRKVNVYIKKPVRPKYDVKVGDSPTMGDKNAKVTIIAYSDFQCPFSKKGSEILKELRDSYGDKVKIVHKDFPLPFHSKARELAEGSMCAKDQSTVFFWRYFYKIFESQMVTSVEDISKEVGLNQKKFTECIKSKKFQGLIEKEIEEAVRLGIKSTPTFFINGKIINGAHNIEVFKSVIDEEMRLN